MLMAIAGQTGKLGAYDGALDGATPYYFEYNSGWLDLTQAGLLLLPKRYEGTFYADNSVTVNYKWAFDFENEWNTVSRTFVAEGGGGEWGLGEWGLSEFGGGLGLRTGRVPANGSGQYIKLGISLLINNSQFAMQKLTLFAKIGRLA